ncbi:N-6 DNA methylase [Rhizobium sp. ERR 922]|uniref:Eco57I restriction-modification methylase domain-containing protein n=1 Tax=unclassified Rhizobium TaxID=2613769 RepID=UPI0011A0D107|nr:MULTISPECIES: N-6 DNA methylase [unclassified Rhizobium]TWB47484.1 N-6 DNA methylase [Rhizobium sp. ERR 922]TWB90886.1 N-6 DNA methylase [Rhizobium sp. ERR 942]
MIKGESAIFSQKQSGAYFTPSDVAQALVSWVLRRPSDRLIDPSCGDGQFISVHHKSVGIEQNPLSAQAAIAAAPWALVHKGDFFAWAAETRERFECAAGNPPFIRYQSFKGDVRRRALDLCSQYGAHFSGLTSSWAPFLVATASLLKPDGRMAFVVPAEIGHAPYAAPLVEYLVGSFAEVHIIAIRRKLFPSLSEDCWLLYAEGHGGSTSRIGLTVCETFKPDKHRPKPDIFVDVDEWRTTWSRRLRPYLLSKNVRDIYATVIQDPTSKRFGDIASIGIGYVSGDNDFFHLRPSEAKRLGIPAAFLHPSLRNGRAMPSSQITEATVEAWTKSDDKVLLLRLTRGQELPSSVQRYLNSSAGREARLGYKCRNRAPWYAVPDVQIPDFVLSYMSGRSANLVQNLAGVTCTNSVHSVRVRDRALAAKLLPQWTTPFVRLSCELEGHALGGGMLKLEPREASRILFPAEARAAEAHNDALEDAINTLHRWRHYAE